MQKNVQFQLEETVEIPKWADAYPENKFTVFKTCFLSTKPNSHELDISAEVLRRDAKSILGNFLVAKIDWGDATTHKDSEIIYGYFPMEQDIEFIEDGDILKAYAYAVVSRKYSKEFNGIFEFDNFRNSSVEMTVDIPNSDNKVEQLDIYGLTCLGKTVKGSCPDADITMVRFAQDEAENYFRSADGISPLKKFVEERNKSMSQSYKIDKSKEAMSNKPWGDVDKTVLRNKIMEADNKAALVKACYMLVEAGWEEAPSEHLKYPVMEIKGDTLVYNRGGLASALGYAKAENETAVVNKVEKIYKSLGLDDSEGKEEKEMSEVETTFAEEEEKKEVETETEVKKEEETEELAEPEKEEEKSEDEQGEGEKSEDENEKDEDAEMSADEMMSKITELEKCIEEKDNIIMQREEDIKACNAELESLRQFKSDVESKEKAQMVESVLNSVSDYLSEDAISEFRTEGLACEMSELDGWSNKVKAVSFENSKGKTEKKKENNGVWGFAAPVQAPKHKGLWD